MKKKILLIVFTVISILAVSGCGNVEKKNVKIYTCTKKGAEKINSVTNEKYIKDITYTAELDKDKKLLKYMMKYNYTYETKESCEQNCKTIKERNDQTNLMNYKGIKRKTKCRCDDKQVEEIRKFNITKMEEVPREDIRELSDDGTFDLERWLKRYEGSYECK